MKKSIKIFMAITVMLSLNMWSAQTKNLKTETIKIYGNCGMCKSTIEKAGNLKNEAQVDWDKDTKMAIISYDSQKTSKEEILKRIALAGYDSDFFLTPGDTYANLPSCCQYKRAKKDMALVEAPKMAVDESIHSDHSAMTEEKQEENQLSKVYESYFKVKDALVKTDGEMTSTNSKELLNAINGVQMKKLSMEAHMVWMKVVNDLKEDAGQMAGTKKIGDQRDHFIKLSNNMYSLIKVSKTETPTYYQFCPMANKGEGANWLSKEETVKNPYYGSQMLSCGKTVETIN